MTKLPSLSIWDHPSLNVLQARLMIKIVRYGLFFNSESEYTPLRCMITRRGYMVIYMKEEALKGHAVKLSGAKKVQISAPQTNMVRKVYINY